MEGKMLLESMDCKDLIFNSIVYLYSQKSIKLKCNCCKTLLSLQNITDHLESNSHLSMIQSYTGSEYDLKLEKGYKEIFLNHIGISLPALLKNTKNFYSFCYKCLRLLTNGANGINQHIRNGHKAMDLKVLDSHCPDCLVDLNNLANHIEKSHFHSFMLQDLVSYGLEIDPSNDEDENLEPIPVEFKNITDYRRRFLIFVKLERKIQRAYVRQCRMDNLTVSWNTDDPYKDKPIGSFRIETSSEQYFKIKLFDEMVIYLDQERWTMRGVIKHVPYSFDDESIQLQLKNKIGLKPHIDGPYSITPKFMEVVFWRLRSALNQVKCLRDHFQKILLEKHVSQEEYNSSENITSEVIEEIKKEKLNDSQKKAVQMAMMKNFTIIHGPPGTGKTTTCVSIVKYLLRVLRKSKKILVCASSNNAVNILALKLETAGIQLVRVFSNHAEDQDESVKHLSLINLALNKDKELQKDYNNYVNNGLSEEKNLLFKNQFEKMKYEILSESNVTCTTLITAGSDQLLDIEYDVLLVDEASQAVEPETLVPIVTFNPSKVILVGDHKQLGPLIMSQAAIQEGFDISIFERLMKKGQVPNILLNKQYRMHPDISAFPNNQFYNDQLSNGVRKEDRNLKLFPNTDKAVIFINVNGEEESFGESYRNPAEADTIIKLLKYLIIKKKIQSKNIGVITLYEGQNLLLCKLSYKYLERANRVEIANVDSFQGKENDIIILSLVRSNKHGNIGFLSSPNRFNVALTRAKSNLVILGNRKTLISAKMYDSLLKHIDENGFNCEDNYISDLLEANNYATSYFDTDTAEFNRLHLCDIEC